MRRSRLSVSALENRDVPATFGIPWANSDFVTVSFVPDGTDVGGAPSELFRVMQSSGLSADTWQREMLRAFQAWLTTANLNLAVVGDSGDAIGVAGAVQGDTRFGDIRISARPLSDNVFAITTPPGGVWSNTQAGDIIVNSNYRFGVGGTSGYDLYTVMLQEAGHAFGIGNSLDQSSAMYEQYAGPRLGLSSQDVASVQQLYGPRLYNLFEWFGNETASTATKIAMPTDSSGAMASRTYADVGKVGDIDWYEFTAPAAGALTIRLEAGSQSLLAGRLTVYDANLKQLGEAVAAGPGQDLAVSLPAVAAGGKYFLRVDGASNGQFQVGSYRVQIQPAGATSTSTNVAGLTLISPGVLNNSWLTASSVFDVTADSRTNYSVVAATIDARDNDFYRFRTGAAGTNVSLVLTASVRLLSDGGIPRLSVFDARGNAIKANVLTSSGRQFILQLQGAAPNTDYYVNVVPNSKGGKVTYYLSANVASVPAAVPPIAQGTASQDTLDAFSLTVFASTQVYFNLSAGTGASSDGVRVTVFDSAGAIVFQAHARAGETIGDSILLAQGTYSIEILGTGRTAIDYCLGLASLSDPISVTPTKPTDTTRTSSGSSMTSTSNMPTSGTKL